MAGAARRFMVDTLRELARAPGTASGPPTADEVLVAALAGRFTPDELRLIAPYLVKRAINARATSRRDQADALAGLGDAVAEAIAFAEGAYGEGEQG